MAFLENDINPDPRDFKFQLFCPKCEEQKPVFIKNPYYGKKSMCLACESCGHEIMIDRLNNEFWIMPENKYEEFFSRNSFQVNDQNDQSRFDLLDL